jgi:HEAT repeat protein
VSDALLLAELSHADPLRRCAVLERMMAIEVLDASLVEAIIACLGLPQKAAQRQAADLLGRSEPGDRPAVATRLRAALASPEPRLRWGATYALSRLGVVEIAMVSPLVEAFGRRDGDERWAAAQIMTACARVHRVAVVPALLAAATDAVPDRRKMALYVLRDVAPDDPSVHAAALHGLDDPAVGVRFAALSAVTRLEPLLDAACERVLVMARDDTDPGVRRAAVITLGQIGRGVSAVTAALEAAATSDDPGLRRAAAIARRRLDA